MYTPAVKVARRQVWALVGRVFPEYAGRKFAVQFAERVTFYDTNWEGGSRNTYAFLRADGKTARLYVPAPWVNVTEGASVDLVPDVLVVQHSVCCGVDEGITIYAHPSNAPRLLESGKA